MKQLCVYCGAEPSTEVIPSPNFDEEELTWDVCETCKEVLKYQQNLCFGMMLQDSNKESVKEFGEKLCKDANNALIEVTKRTKKPIFNAVIMKKSDVYDVESVHYE